MVELVKKIVTNVLMALYQPFGFAVLMTILFMFVFIFAQEKGWKMLLKQWLNMFKYNRSFRRMFFLFFYVSMILFRTLLNRNLWINPLSDVLGVWGLYNANGEMTTESLENLALFVPFTVLLLWTFQERILGKEVTLLKILAKCTSYVFLFSLCIEFLQLFFMLGTFQLSDLFYNTLGGLVGGLIYWIGYRITHRNSKEDYVDKVE